MASRQRMTRLALTVGTSARTDGQSHGKRTHAAGGSDGLSPFFIGAIGAPVRDHFLQHRLLFFVSGGEFTATIDVP